MRLGLGRFGMAEHSRKRLGPEWIGSAGVETLGRQSIG